MSDGISNLSMTIDSELRLPAPGVVISRRRAPRFQDASTSRQRPSSTGECY
jgi:hypothetical protein